MKSVAKAVAKAVSKTVKKNKDWEGFTKLFVGVQSQENVDLLFQLFMTFNEREMFTDRFRLVQALLSGDFSQREVAELLNLSVSKVTAGSKALQILDPEQKKIIAKKIKPLKKAK